MPGACLPGGVSVGVLVSAQGCLPGGGGQGGVCLGEAVYPEWGCTPPPSVDRQTLVKT